MKLKSKLKKALVEITGYWFRKRNNLPSGIDLFYDIQRISNEDIEIIFDVGANKGQSVSFFKEEYNEAHIYSFEPIKSIIPILERNTKKYSNVYVENKALGDVHGMKTVRLFEDIGYSSSLNSLDPDLMNNDPNALEQQVEVTTLDHFIDSKGIEKIDLLKLDVEKWEMQVLKGGLKNLTEGKVRHILCEVGFSKVNSRHTDFIEIFDYLRELGFCFIGIYDLMLFEKRGHFGNALFKYDKKNM